MLPRITLRLFVTIFVLVILLCSAPLTFSQRIISGPDSAFLSVRTIEARRITTPPKIDGKLDEAFWKELPVAGNFVQYQPENGAKPSFPTEIRFAYDDMALYVGCIMSDPCPDSIFKELGLRDELDFLSTDYISIDILPYNDDLNMYEFKVTPANVQNDCKYSPVGQDCGWDAVWESAAKINSDSWVAEFRIPYSALRFPNTQNQVWGINMWRSLERRKENSTWSFVDIEVKEIFKYYGELVGIDNIRPPLRLSFTPYVSGYLDKGPGDEHWSVTGRGGLDLKYGINESYTLDMMVIPDFGQVPPDDLILNLTPFEIQYDEKRQFFTEGTEMFNKCGIFYTRRVGGMPKDYDSVENDLAPSEKIVKNPSTTQMINATKISGRNASGLGIGVFNALTANTWATIQDTVTGAKRKYLTQPFTNYNVLVFDQSLKNNSYVTLINTNFYIPDQQYCANVTGTNVSLYNRRNTFSAYGLLNVSQIYVGGVDPVFGYNYEVKVSKPSGKFQYVIVRQDIGSTYNINDMGFLPYNNEANNVLQGSYNIFTPVGNIISSKSTLSAVYSTLSKPVVYTEFSLNGFNNTVFKNYWAIEPEATWSPFGKDDYYEPRTWGWVYKRPPYYMGKLPFMSDGRKAFYLGITLAGGNSPENHNSEWEVTLLPRIRFSDRFNMALSTGYGMAQNDYGFAENVFDSLNNQTIIFGRRDLTTVNNILTTRYVFTPEISLSLRLRHYWSKAEYLSFYTLNHDGSLTPTGYIPGNDLNFNAFTVDLQFIWKFAPGSEISVVWKNAINTLDNIPAGNYFTDLDNTLNAPQSNSFSIRILYYLDYLNLKKALGRKPAPANPG